MLIDERVRDTEKERKEVTFLFVFFFTFFPLFQLFLVGEIEKMEGNCGGGSGERTLEE